MRRFLIVKPDGSRDEGCSFECGAVGLVQAQHDGSVSFRFVDKSILEHHYGELRFIDPENDDRLTNPPAAWTGEGDPVYTPQNPPPREGKLPSERISEIAKRRGIPTGNGGFTYETGVYDVIEFLDEQHRERNGR